MVRLFTWCTYMPNNSQLTVKQSSLDTGDDSTVEIIDEFCLRDTTYCIRVDE